MYNLNNVNEIKNYIVIIGTKRKERKIAYKVDSVYWLMSFSKKIFFNKMSFR